MRYALKSFEVLFIAKTGESFIEYLFEAAGDILGFVKFFS